MAISDEEAVAWAEERAGRERDVPPGGELSGPPPAAVDPAATAAPRHPAPPATAPARRELTVALTLLAGEGDAATLRACYSVGADGAPYPIISTLAIADIAEAAAQIPARIAEAEARWLAQPNLPRARDGAAVARPATTTAKPATGKAAGAAKGRAKGGEGAAGDAAHLAAALLRDATDAAPTTPPAPTAPTVATTPDAATAPGDPPAPPPPPPARNPEPAARGAQLSLFG